MKAFRLLFVIIILGFAATMVRADGIDPKITIGGGGSCSENSLTSLTQSFTGLATGCLNDITNNTGQTLFEVVVNVTSAFTGQLSCAIGSNSPFTSFVQTSATSCTFFVPTDDELEEFSGGLPSGQGSVSTFSLTFDNDPGGAGGFNNNSVDVTIAQTVISTPEPASALLLLTGFGALAAFRKRRQVQA